MERLRGAGTLITYVLLAVTWGSSFLLLTVALREFSPVQAVLGRLVFGSIALLVLCAVTRTTLPRPSRLWGSFVIVALVMCVIPFSLYAWAQQQLTSGTASVLNATTPLMAAVAGLALLPGERLPVRGVIGLLTGFAGVVVVIVGSRGLGGSDSVLPALACLGATACYGIGFVVLRRFVMRAGLSALAVATMQVCLAAVIAAVVSVPLLITARWPDPGSADTLPALASLAALGAVGTGVAYLWNTTVVQRWGATAASTVTYLTPAVGVALGAAVLAEPVGWSLPVGAAVIVLGIVLVQLSARRRSRPTTTPEPGPTTT